MKKDKIFENRIDEANALACDMNYKESEMKDHMIKIENQ